MKLTVEEIESVINYLSSAVTYAQAARRIARRVYGNDKEISAQLKIAHEDIRRAADVLEGVKP